MLILMILEIGQFKTMAEGCMLTIIRKLIIVSNIFIIIGCVSMHDQNHLYKDK